MKNKRKKTKNGLEILKKRAQRNPILEELYQDEIITANIADLLRETRKKLGISQVELAKMIGTQQSVISRLEDADYQGHTLSILQKIARALGKQVIFQMIDIR